MRPVFSLPLTCFLIAGCGADRDDPAGRALALADTYVSEYFARSPESAMEAGYTGVDLNRLGDYSLEGTLAWEAREDELLRDVTAIEPGTLEGTPASVPYGYLKERLEASIGHRICHTELWNVSPTWTGWQNRLAQIFALQPVGSDELRAAALARARDLPRFLDTEIANLNEGLRLGYTAPKHNVELVIGQMDGLLALAPAESPFYGPAGRDSAPGFADQFASVITQEIHPAVQRYRDFLATTYLPRAREVIAVSADPGGEACYRAAVRYYTSLDMTPEEVHRTGLEQMAAILVELRVIGKRGFGTDSPRVLLQLVRTDPRYTFGSRQEMVDYATAAVGRARDAVPNWFGFVPKADVVVRPYALFQEQSAPGGEYVSGAEDGSRPGVYLINTYEAEKKSKAGLESTAFHETYPGHHFQGAVALERAGVHPILKYFYNSGYGEGWALYSERLSDEMGVFSTDLDRVGLLSNEALRAARLVVDAGMHTLGWTRQQAIDYLLEHTAESEASATAEIDRYIAVPGQATAYMLGNLEIRRLRDEASERLGEGFDIKAFHDRLLEDGTVTLAMMREKIEAWVAGQGSTMGD
jgi:uncharacterized protein (DUF885 family)